MTSWVRSGRWAVVAAALAVALGVWLWVAQSVAADGGGGSAALFSFDRASPSVAGHSPADLFVDDIGSLGPGGPPATLTVPLTAEALGLEPSANIVGFSAGRDNGLPVIIFNLNLEPNQLNQVNVIYQFSAGRGLY